MPDVDLIFVGDMLGLTAERTFLVTVPVDVDERSPFGQLLEVGFDGSQLLYTRLEIRFVSVREISGVDYEVELFSLSLVDDLLKRFRVSVVVPKARIRRCDISSSGERVAISTAVRSSD